MNVMNLQIEFYQPETAAVLIESNVTGKFQTFGEILLLASFTVRQLHNLRNLLISDELAHALLSNKKNGEYFDSSDSPRVSNYKGFPGKHRFLADLKFDEDRARFLLHPKGFGFFGQGANYYAPISVIVLFKFLAQKHSAETEYAKFLKEVARLSATTFLERKVSSINQSSLCLAIAWYALGYSKT